MDARLEEALTRALVAMAAKDDEIERLEQLVAELTSALHANQTAHESALIIARQNIAQITEQK